MRKPEPIPPEILRDIGNEVLDLWQHFRRVVAAELQQNPDAALRHRVVAEAHCNGPEDLVAAILTQAAIIRVNEVHMGPPKEKPHE